MLKRWPKLASRVSIFIVLLALYLVVYTFIKKRNIPLEKEVALHKKDYLSIAAWLILSSVFVYAVGAFFYIKSYGIEEEGMLSILQKAFVLSDANHYIDIAKNGYTAVGESRYFIVFFPLFPLLLRLFSYLTFGNYMAAAMLLNHVCLYIACLYLYRLCAQLYNLQMAKKTVRYLLFYPLAFFFRIPYSESLFLMTSVISMYYALNRKNVKAGVAGLFSALTRMTGVLCFLPIVTQRLLDWYTDTKTAQSDKKVLLSSLLPPAGTGIYLFINKIVTGKWLTFLTHQKEHWYNGFVMFWYAIETTISYLIFHENAKHKVLYISQSVSIFFMLILLVYLCYKLTPTLSLYSCAYFIMMISSAWLISGARYLMCMFPALLALSVSNDKKIIDLLITALFVLLLGVMCALFVLRYPIY